VPESRVAESVFGAVVNVGGAWRVANAEWISLAIAEAVAAERESCAAFAEILNSHGRFIAEKIRAGEHHA